MASVPLRISDLAANATVDVGDTLIEIEQTDLAAGSRSRKLRLDDLRDLLTPAGMLGAYAGTSAPDGWLACDGSAVSRSTYARLFAAIGTTWGAGDGSTTFNLPDLRGAFLRGAGSHGSETMANGSAFAGPSVGAVEDDQMQGHHHSEEYKIFSAPTGNVPTFEINGVKNQTADLPGFDVGDPVADGTNGTPRTGDETRPFAAGVYYCIKT